MFNLSDFVLTFQIAVPIFSLHLRAYIRLDKSESWIYHRIRNRGKMLVWKTEIENKLLFCKWTDVAGRLYLHSGRKLAIWCCEDLTSSGTSSHGCASVQSRPSLSSIGQASQRPRPERNYLLILRLSWHRQIPLMFSRLKSFNLKFSFSNR